MKWQNAARDFLPATSRSVLISHKGVYRVAFYDNEKRVFQLGDEEGSVVIAPSENFYWTDLDVISIENKKDRLVLIVDDDVDDQKFMKQELLICMPNLQVDSVYNGEQALDYLLRKGQYKTIPKLPDLILLDLNLPIKDGFSVMEEMIKHQQLKNIPVFVISTSRSVDQWDKALNLGARCFFNKGTTMADVRRVAQEVCLSL